jgi:beta-glucanase (GH16 family)
MTSRRAPRRTRTGTALSAALLVILGWTLATGCAAHGGGASSSGPTTSFSDDFNGPAGSAVDSAKWRYETGDNVANHEREYYTYGTDNAALDGHGDLVITARKENPANYQCWYGSCEYTSARLYTAQTFTQKYGHFETRMKLPRGQGVWPAFWMLGNDFGTVGWPTCGEIDVMENIGSEPGTVHGTLHGPGYSGSNGLGAGYSLPAGQSFADAFHTFAVDWSPGSVSFSVDGHVYETRTPADTHGSKWVFDHPFYLILNLAIGGDWPGDPNSATVFPQQLVIDYVHVTTSNSAPASQSS